MVAVAAPIAQRTAVVQLLIVRLMAVRLVVLASVLQHRGHLTVRRMVSLVALLRHHLVVLGLQHHQYRHLAELALVRLPLRLATLHPPRFRLAALPLGTRTILPKSPLFRRLLATL